MAAEKKPEKIDSTDGLVDAKKEQSTEPIKEPQPQVEAEFVELRQQVFSYGSTDTKVDYLFIIDNSVSMDAILGKVRLGFKSILEDSTVFSRDSKVAFMNTMIAQLTTEGGDLNSLSQYINQYAGIELEPGFLSLVDYDAYAAYHASLEVPQRRKNKWVLPPCEEAWFEPTKTHINGHYCFEAASQISASATYAEPGIKAFEQFLTKNEDKNIFREDAIVNVIFVSDTHDPGVEMDQAYLDSRLNYEMFKDKLELIQNVKDLKFHAIAPTSTTCSGTGELLWDKSYLSLVSDSNGQSGDSCTLTDYSDLMKQLVKKAQAEEPVFKLGIDVDEIIEVKINNRTIKDFVFDSEGNTVTIPTLDPYTPVQIEVNYR